eukprot:4940037-Amphidinium_carterae.1
MELLKAMPASKSSRESAENTSCSPKYSRFVQGVIVSAVVVSRPATQLPSSKPGFRPWREFYPTSRVSSLTGSSVRTAAHYPIT